MALIASLALPTTAAASAPRERIRSIVTGAEVALRDQSFPEGQRRERVRALLDDAFDFRSMARDALGPHWSRLTPAQQQEFARLFGDRFEASYRDLVLGLLPEREALFGREVVQSDRAFVHTTLRDRRGDEVAVDYTLVESSGRWRVHDVVVDGVSLAATYRDRLSRVIVTSSYETLRARVEPTASVVP